MKRIWLHRGDISTGVALGIILLLVTWLAYIDGGSGSSYVHFYYIPIVAASYLLGDLGGIVTAFAAVLAALLSVLVGPLEPPQDMAIRGLLFYFIGIMTSRLFNKLQERREEAASLLEVSRSVNASLRVTEVLRTITETTVNITAAKSCSIRLLSRERDELTAAASYGLSLDYLAKGPVLLAESPLDREVLAGHPVAILDVSQDPRFRYRDEARAEGLVSVFCLPLQRRGEPFGVLRVYAGSRHHWSRRERRLLQAFAEQASVAIHNARLHEDLRRSYWETVNALARAIEAKDPHTLGHSERVTDYALQLGRALELNVDEMETLRFAATLHDVGKIGLTDASLSRSGHLDMTDEVVLRMHPLIGISILQPVEFLAPALDAVRYHHERWDGRGYPQGLSKEEIPLQARILTVANLYDNLRTSSPGRPGLSVQEAAGALREAAGKELDPKLAAAFLQALGDRPPGRPGPRPPGQPPPRASV
ncbi:MAG: GAF domain-containing protein [Armatimonadetes bacterium]|nr:GAF domain-containing protein [Armatimonadota bacterium]